MDDGEDEDEVCHSVVGGLCAARDFPSQEILTVTKRGLAENSKIVILILTNTRYKFLTADHSELSLCLTCY